MRNLWGVIEDLAAKTKPVHIFWSTIAIDLALLIVILFFFLLPSSARFTVDALTEQVKFISTPGMPPPFWGDLPVFRQSVNGQLVKKCKAPKLRLPETLDKRIDVFVWTHDKGEVEATIKTNDDSPVGQLFCENKLIGASKNLEVLVWTGQEAVKLTLPFSGLMTIGAEAPNGSTKVRLLISGVLVTEALSFPFKTSHARTETNLRLGDKVELFQNTDQNLMAISHGIIRPENSTLRVVAHAMAVEARILSIGQDKSRPLSVAPSFWNKLNVQPEWAIFLIIGSLLLHMLSAFHTFVLSKTT